jgi:DNA-binding SARP family transcriptional activator
MRLAVDSQDPANNRLRSTLWRIHRLPRPVLHVSATHLTIDADLAVDVRELEESSKRVIHGGIPAAVDLDCVVHGDDLPLDWYEDWMVDERDRLGQIRPALETACAKLVATGRTTHAIVVGIAAVASAPLRDRATRAPIPAYGAGRSLAAALRRFETYRAALAAALQLDPSPQMLGLVRSLAPVVA